VFAKVGEEVIADDRVHFLETFASSYLVLGGGGWGDRWDRVNDGGEASSDGGHNEVKSGEEKR